MHSKKERTYPQTVASCDVAACCINTCQMRYESVLHSTCALMFTMCADTQGTQMERNYPKEILLPQAIPFPSLVSVMALAVDSVTFPWPVLHHNIYAHDGAYTILANCIQYKCTAQRSEGATWEAVLRCLLVKETCVYVCVCVRVCGTFCSVPPGITLSTWMLMAHFRSEGWPSAVGSIWKIPATVIAMTVLMM